MRLKWSLLVAVLLLASAPVRADRRDLEAGRQLLRQVEYEKAAQALERALVSELGREEKIEANLLLAKAYLGLRREGDAARSLRALLSLDRDHRISPAREPPGLVDLLERVRQEMGAPAPPRRAARPRIQHAPVAKGYAGLGVTFHAEVSDLGRDHRARVHWRRIGQLRFETLELVSRAGTQHVATLPGVALAPEAADYLVEYYLSVVDGVGEVMARVGSEEKPLNFRVIVLAHRKKEGGAGLAEAPPWYKRHWWIWVALGAVVVGGTVAGVATTR